MTPVEKARDLVGNFYIIEDSKTNDDAWMDYYLSIRSAQVAVELALEFAGGDMNEQFDKILYLVEVKHELESMLINQLKL
jgi:hypothetical protein